MRGYKAISNWADALGQQARERFGCRRENGRYVVPSEYVIRDCLVRIEPGALDRVLKSVEPGRGAQDEALAMGCQRRLNIPQFPPVENSPLRRFKFPQVPERL
jgi:hypothetical protein